MKTLITNLIALVTLVSLSSGTFAAQFNFTPRASAQEEYTDNVFLTDDNTEDDFITRVSAGFIAELLGKTSGVSLSFFPGYNWYEEFDENNTWNLPANLRAWVQPSRATRFEFTDTFIRTEDPVPQDQLVSQNNQVEEVGDPTVRRGREPYYRNLAAIRASHQFGEEDQVYGGFRWGLLRNDDDQVEDNDFYRPYAGLDYWFSQWFGSNFWGEYTRGEYDQQSGFTGIPSGDFNNYWGYARFLGRMTRHFSLFVQYDQIYRNYTSGIENDYLVYAPSAGFSYDISEDAYVRLGLGYYWQDIDNENMQENPFINGEASKTWNFRRGLINILGLAGLSQQDFGAQNTGFQQFASVGGTGVYNFTRKFFGDLNAYYRYSHTPEDTNLGGGDDLNTHQVRTGAGLGFLPWRWMTLALRYQLNWYETNTDNDYTENRVIFSITLQPDRPWRF